MSTYYTTNNHHEFFQIFSSISVPVEKYENSSENLFTVSFDSTNQT